MLGNSLILKPQAILHFNRDSEELGGKEDRAEGGTNPKQNLNVVMKPGSLVVFDEDAYFKYKHHINNQEEELVDNCCANRELAQVQVGDKIVRKTRVSLTLRIVPNVKEDSQIYTGEHLQSLIHMIIICTDSMRREAMIRRSMFLRNISESHKTN